MRSTKDVWSIIGLSLTVLALALSFLALVLYVGSGGEEGSIDPGIKLLNAMYTFATPRELVKNQATVEELLVPEEWERLQLDNTYRAVNTYYKFKYDASRVDVLWNENGWVCYKLDNEHIGDWRRWLLYYEVDPESGRLCNIKEYQALWGRGTLSIDNY